MQIKLFSLLLILLFFSDCKSQNLPDTFAIIKSEKGFKQLTHPYAGFSYYQFDTLDLADKLISCIVGKYLLDTVLQYNRDTIFTRKNNSYLEIKRVSKTEITIALHMNLSVFDSISPKQKNRSDFTKDAEQVVDLLNHQIKVTNHHNNPGFFENPGDYYLGIESYFFYSAARNVKFERFQYNALRNRYKKRKGEEADKTKNYVPILLNSGNLNWQIFLSFHDNPIISGINFTKID